MRKLYLVPIIHTSADIGSLASALNGRAAAELGQKVWQKHKSIVSGFWDGIARFFSTLDVNGFRVYQDGLIADGDQGSEIVGQGIKEGSQNYEIISRLLQAGAILVKTEDISLVKKEFSLITKMAQAKSFRQREAAALRYKMTQGRLLEQRDSFIATRINETLREDETGILFIGAYHHVLPKLAPDIKVKQVKEATKVEEYHRALIKKRRYDQYLEELAKYLVSPISTVSP